MNYNLLNSVLSGNQVSEYCWKWFGLFCFVLQPNPRDYMDDYHVSVPSISTTLKRMVYAF